MIKTKEVSDYEPGDYVKEVRMIWEKDMGEGYGRRIWEKDVEGGSWIRTLLNDRPTKCRCIKSRTW
jgi:hypothetical protein